MPSPDQCYQKEHKTGATRPGTSENLPVKLVAVKGKQSCAFCKICVLHPEPFQVNPQVGWVCKVCRKYPKHTRDGSYVSVPVFFNLFRERVPAIYFPCRECGVFFEKKARWVERCSLECEGVAYERYLERGRNAWEQANTPSLLRRERLGEQ